MEYYAAARENKPLNLLQLLFNWKISHYVKSEERKNMISLICYILNSRTGYTDYICWDNRRDSRRENLISLVSILHKKEGYGREENIDTTGVGGRDLGYIGDVVPS